MAGYFGEDTMTPGERERYRAYGTFLLGAGGLYLWMTSREGVPVKVATSGTAKLKKIEVTQVTGFGIPNDKEVNLSAKERSVDGFDMSLSVGILVSGSGNLSASVSAKYDDGTSSETKQLGGNEQADYTAFTINNRDFTKADKSIKSYTVAVTAKDGSAVSATTFTVGA
jgi:hypothetical protein